MPQDILGRTLALATCVEGCGGGERELSGEGRKGGRYAPSG